MENIKEQIVVTKDLVNNLLVKINEICNKNEWQVSKQINPIEDLNFKSHNQRKKLKRFYMKTQGFSIKSINSFLNYLAQILEVQKIVIRPSLKEEKIQSLRKEWKVLRKLEQEALLKYKEEKGDFYK